MQNPEILLVYDKVCPLCDYYCRRVRVRESVGELQRVDARGRSEILDAITARGWDIDQGMVLKIGEQMYYGADAIHALALISSRANLFNRLAIWLFQSARLSRWLYPVLRSCRNLLLKLLRKDKINNLNLAGNTKF